MPAGLAWFLSSKCLWIFWKYRNWKSKECSYFTQRLSRVICFLSTKRAQPNLRLWRKKRRSAFVCQYTIEKANSLYRRNKLLWRRQTNIDFLELEWSAKLFSYVLSEFLKWYHQSGVKSFKLSASRKSKMSQLSVDFYAIQPRNTGYLMAQRRSRKNNTCEEMRKIPTNIRIVKCGILSRDETVFFSLFIEKLGNMISILIR